MRTALFVTLALLLPACASAPTAAEKDAEPKIAASSEPAPKKDLPAPSTSYYSGIITVSSPDGSSVETTQQVLVKREVRPSEGLIVETVVTEGEPRTTTFTQKNGRNIFEATDDANSFSGTVTFAPNPWKAISWSYDLDMADGSGSLQGTATVMPNGITIMRYLVGPDGLRKAQIIDKLQVATEDEYEAAASQ